VLDFSSALWVVCRVQVGDVGQVLAAVFLDDNEQPVDVSGASAVQIYVTRPDLTTVALDGSYTTDGVDGALQGETLADTFNAPGRYAVQGYVAETAAGFTGFSDRFEYDVGRAPEVQP
jgi:hypothetical protein